MSQETKIVSKVLIHEFENIALTLLKDVCIKNNLVGLRVGAGNRSIGLEDVSNEVTDVLSSNLDLGAVFLTEAPDDKGVSGLELAVQINQLRPELPIFLRRTTRKDLPEDVEKAIAGSYENNNIQELDNLLEAALYSIYYPVELAQGFQDIATQVFESLIPGVKVMCDFPYLVKDQLIYGELFTLIPIESNWCRGYMMLQTTENEVIDLIRSGATAIESARPGRNDINAILNEATNLIWGKARACYFSSVDDSPDQKIHVPILINHGQKHMSFGSTEPQLCFKYKLFDKKYRFKEVTIYQRLIFNLSWSPEKFAENDKIVEHFVEGGELEMF